MSGRDDFDPMAGVTDDDDSRVQWQPLHEARHRATETTCGDECPFELDAKRWANALGGNDG